MRVRSAPEENQQHDDATSSRVPAMPSNHHTSLSMPVNSADVIPQQSEIELGQAAPSVSRGRDAPTVAQIVSKIVSQIIGNQLDLKNVSCPYCPYSEIHKCFDLEEPEVYVCVCVSVHWALSAGVGGAITSCHHTQFAAWQFLSLYLPYSVFSCL